MKKFDRFKNELYSKLPAIFFILLIIATGAVAMDEGQIDHFFGFPDINMHIENENSYLFNYLIKYQDFSEDWIIEEVDVVQLDESANAVSHNFIVIDIDGEYKASIFNLEQYVREFNTPYECIEAINKRVENRYNDPEINSYEEIHISNAHPETEISHYCFYRNKAGSNNSDYTSCSLFQINDKILSNMEIQVRGKLNKQQVIQITDELEAMMEKTK